MVDIREQIIEALETICGNLKAVSPEGEATFPMITYAETGNAETGKWVDTISYQIDSWANTFEECLSQAHEISDAMTALGFTRTYTSPDGAALQAKDLYRKAMTFRARVNTHDALVIRNFR